jgi:sugar (pentulose or hexulose) kinase
MTAGDQPCGTLGVGVSEPGIMGINGGTSCTCEVFSHELPIDPNRSYFIEVSPLGDYLPESAIYSGASALMNWYKDNFGARRKTQQKRVVEMFGS